MKVSVLVMTYNHEHFIAQAIQSALMQETSFDFEIVVVEDCSTDNTRHIVQELKHDNPSRIRLVLSERNIRSNEIVARGIQAARGTYIALLDGDDYWTCPSKLQQQVDVLDAHPEYAICFHNAAVVYENHERPTFNWTAPGQNLVTTLEDLWMGNYIATCSAMFRRGFRTEIPDWYYAFFPITDWPLHLMSAEHGKITYIDQVMGVYRYHEGGLYSGLSEARKQDTTFQLYLRLNAAFDYRYDRYAKAGLFNYFLEWAEEYAARGEWGRVQECLKRCVKGYPKHRINGWKRFARIWLKAQLRARFT